MTKRTDRSMRFAAIFAALALDVGSICAAAPAAPVPPLAGVGDAFWNAVPAHWVQMADAETIRIGYERDKPAGYVAIGDDRSMTSAWSGAAVDGRRVRGAGGGHLNSANNAVWEHDRETGRFGLFVQPSMLTDADIRQAKAIWDAKGGWLDYTHLNGKDGLAPDGKYGAFHTYGMMQTIKGVTIIKDHYYDEVTKKLVLLPAPGGPNANSAVWGDRIIGTNWVGPFSLLMIDGDRGFAVTIGALQYPYRRGQGAGISFSERSYSVVVDGQLHTIATRSSPDDPGAFAAPLSWSVPLPIVPGDNPTTITTAGLRNRWTPADMDGVQFNTQALDEATGTVYLPARDWSYFLTWKPRTGELGKVTVDGALPPAELNASYQRFAIYRGCFTLINSIDERPYARRLPVASR